MDEAGVILACSGCGRKNRLPFPHLAAVVRCAACKGALGPPQEPVEVPSVEAFERLLHSATLPIVVDFWASWCAPCRMVAPEIEKLAASQAGRVLVGKVCTEEVPELAARYAVRSIPTLAVFRDGTLVASEAGARPAAEIERFVLGVLARAV
jgi:thioredoxin 2